MTEEELVRKIVELERRLDNLALPERGWAPHFLTTPYTHTSFDGDSFSDVAASTLIDNASWSTTIPADAKALLVQIICRDEASAATAGLYVYLFGAAAAALPAVVAAPSGKANDDPHVSMGICPATNGDIWYQVNASGAGTMDIWLRVFGYWI